MKVKFLHLFDKDLDKIKEISLKAEVADIIISLEQAASLKALRNVKKLKGFKNAYRIKVKEYRLGFYYENGVVELARFLNRKDIYRSFPK